MIFISGQVGEANDLLPDIAAKAANLKVFQFRGVATNNCDEDLRLYFFGPRLGQVMKPAQIFLRSFHLRQKPGSRG